MTNYKLATSEQLEYMRSRIKELIQQDQHADMPSVEEQEKTPDDEFAENCVISLAMNTVGSLTRSAGCKLFLPALGMICDANISNAYFFWRNAS